jgi:enoyl-CoA hydratase
MAYNNIILEREGPLGIITINRPPVNALDDPTVKELAAALAEVAADDGVRVVILTGAGPHSFVAGADIGQFTKLDEKTGKEVLKYGQDVFTTIETYPKPVIAAINGVCLGGGNELAMCCDIRIAAESARFGQPEINLGIIPGWGGTQRMPRLIGRGRALELMLTGDIVKAPEALRLGLVNRVVPDGELLAQTKNLARKLANQAPLAMAAIKRAVAEGLDRPIGEGLATELRHFMATFATEDAKEGVGAFLGKRRPQFKGK